MITFFPFFYGTLYIAVISFLVQLATQYSCGILYKDHSNHKQILSRFLIVHLRHVLYFYQQIYIILPVSSGVLSKAHNFFLCLFFYTPSNSESQPTPRLSTKPFFLHPSLIRWMLYIATDYCRLLIKFKQELKALAEAFVRNFPKFY